MDNLPYADQNQLLTMASIIEKETAVAEERDRVASVFINRLRIGMRLQTDPTVIYGMGEGYNGKLTRKDLETPTAYNTYTISGLPPPYRGAGRSVAEGGRPSGENTIPLFCRRRKGAIRLPQTSSAITARCRTI